jgi:hypothetical protein
MSRHLLATVPAARVKPTRTGFTARTETPGMRSERHVRADRLMHDGRYMRGDANQRYFLGPRVSTDPQTARPRSLIERDAVAAVVLRWSS